MSGMDEIPSSRLFNCGCDDFGYWAMRDRVICFGWLNNDNHPWIRKGGRNFGDPTMFGRVNLKHGYNITLGMAENKVLEFRCIPCGNVIRWDNSKFKILLAYLRRHWDDRTRK